MRPPTKRATTAGFVAKGLREAGFEWRAAGCSLCLGMNPDRLEGRQICASSSNRNFKGRMGCKEAEVYLASPETVAASAVAGCVADPREA